MENIVYVIGHKNPDTDSMVSAVALANLKKMNGMKNVIAARAGAANIQTEYIFQRFSCELPLLVQNLTPKVEFYMYENPVVLREDITLWEAMKLISNVDGKAVPIVSSDGQYHSMLYYSAFGKNILKKINPSRKSVIPTSVYNLIQTIMAQPLCVFDEKEIFNGSISVAAMDSASFSKYIQAEPAENKILVVGNRENVQKIAIENGVRVIILSNGFMPSKEIKSLAEKHRVSILVSSYDTSGTALLITYSTPVSTVSDASISPVHTLDLMDNTKTLLKESACHCLAVVDSSKKVIGVIDERSFIKDANIELILVDHNELSQAVEGASNYHIREVVDHHRIGSLTTTYPINFINRVVGSTSTIVASMYRDSRVSLSKQMASLLLSGILSDTLVLRSSTTTEVDVEMAEYLSGITDLDIAKLGEDIMQASSEAIKKPAKDIIAIDKKEYNSADVVISVSQIELTGLTPLVNRRDEVISALNEMRKEKKYYLAALMATDINLLSSVMFVSCEDELNNHLPYTELYEGVFSLKDILSRKKQLMPILSEIIEKIRK